MEPGTLISGVELIEEQVEAGQALVDVLGSEIDAVVVVPERAHRLVDVARGRERLGREAGQDVWIVLVVEVADLEAIDGVAVALRRRVPVVQVGRNRWLDESDDVYQET